MSARQKLNKDSPDPRTQDGPSDIPGVGATRKQKLNLVLCGSDGSLKTSVSKLITEKKDVELHGCLINLVELPALTGLSEEEVMRQALHCLSLCQPGVHAFLMIIPYASIKNEDKVEMEAIQRIFSLSIKNHLMILIIQENNISQKQIQTSVTEMCLQSFECRQFVLKNDSQVSDLLQDVENMIQGDREICYTTFMYLQAQLQLERNKHKTEIEELRSMMKTDAGVSHDDEDDGGVRIVLLGKTGVGKSATGNTILRNKPFKSELNSGSVTRQCEKQIGEFSRRSITVIDTPGLFDTGVDNEEIRKEIVRCISMASPGPHVFLLVIQLARFTQEEKDAVKMIQETFGEKSSLYTIVLFTRGDDLGEKSVEEFIQTNPSLENLVQQCGKKYHVFNNRETENQTQVSELLDKIDRMVAENGGRFYTNEMFQQVERNIKENQKRIMKEKEEENKKREEELKAKYVEEIEKIKIENERKLKEMLDELKQTEEEIKKREKEMKKETNEQKELLKQLEQQKKEYEKENKKRKEEALEEKQNTIKYLEEKHKNEQEILKEKIRRETREQAERDYSEKVTYRAKLAGDWDEIVPFVGGAAGGLVGGVMDLGATVGHKIGSIF